MYRERESKDLRENAWEKSRERKLDCVASVHRRIVGASETGGRANRGKVSFYSCSWPVAE